MSRFAKIIILSAALLLCGVVPAQDGGPTALLELNQQFFYEHDPFPIRVSLNLSEGAKAIENPVAGPLIASFIVTDLAGKVIPPTGEITIEEPPRPKKLVPGSFYGLVLDLSQAFPELKTVGQYKISWKSGPIESPTLIVHVLPKFDISKQYQASIRTPEGDIVIRLFGREAPIAVKAFVDMANADFYDGLLIHEVRPGRFIAIGDPATGESPRVAFLYPAERTSIPLVAGTVVMKPSQPTPPANSSEFMVLLAPEPTWDGQVTAFGQVTKGMDLVQKYSRTSTSGRNSRPFFRPFEDIRLSDVVITERKLSDQQADGE